MNGAGSSKNKFVKIKKPSSPKTLFMRENRERARTIVGDDVQAMMKQLETWWCGLSAEEKMPFQDKTLVEEKRFHQSIQNTAKAVCII